MKLLTAELTGKPLDWALAVAFGLNPEICYGGIVGVQDSTGCWHDFKSYTDPVVWGGLIGHGYGVIQSLASDFCPNTGDHLYYAGGYPKEFGRMVRAAGDTPAEAVARCVVQMRIGDEVEVPDELCGVQS